MQCEVCKHKLTVNGFCRSCNNPSKIGIPGFTGKSHKEESNIKRMNTIKNMYKIDKYKMGFASKNGYKSPKGTIPWNKNTKGLQVAWNKLPEREIICKHCEEKIIISQNSKKQFCTCSCWTRYRFLDDEYLRKKVEQLHNGKQERITRWALKIGKILENNKILFEYEYRVGRFWADLYVPKFNLLIECDGEYWHNYPYGTDKDWRKIKYYKKENYNILNLWNSSITLLNENELFFIITKYGTEDDLK